MTLEIISRSISTKVWYRAVIELAIPRSAIGLATNCTMGPGINTNSFGILSENILHRSDNECALYIRLIVILQAQLKRNCILN